MGGLKSSLQLGPLYPARPLVGLPVIKYSVKNMRKHPEEFKVDNLAKSQLTSFYFATFNQMFLAFCIGKLCLYLNLWKNLSIQVGLVQLALTCIDFPQWPFIHRGSKWFPPDWIFLQSWSFSLDSKNNIAMWSNHFPTSCHHATKSAPQKPSKPQNSWKDHET